jgi:uncharacterized protein involved in type VI secretion and phage assembly
MPNRETLPLAIDTVLDSQESAYGDPPFFLAMVQGSEGVSVPYCYEVMLFRDPKRDDVAPEALIGTACTIHINRHIHDEEEQAEQFLVRKGVFEHFERVAASVRGFRVYYGRIVPAFKLLVNETRYRVFEDEDVTAILQHSLSEVSHLRFNTNLLRDEKFPKLDYCVQFGETTFGFVSRLMARYGMWYYFDHDLDPHNETLVIGRRANARTIPNAEQSQVYVTQERDPSDDHFVFNFIRKCDPTARKISVSSYNPLEPTAPFEGSATVVAPYQLVDAAAAQRFDQVAFSEPVTSNQEAHAAATRLVQRGESGVYSATGNSHNPTFVAGRWFVVENDLTDDQVKDDALNRRLFGDGKPTYLITHLSFVAAAGKIGATVWNTIGSFWRSLTKDIGSGDTPDLTVSIANGMLSGYLESTVETGLRNAWDVGRRDADPFFPVLFSGSAASLAGVIPNILHALKDVADSRATRYGNSFVAVPFNPSNNIALLPPVQASRPIANGPQLAVVIGPDGSKPFERRDLYADALGRVRVRFPSDPGPSGSAFSRWETDKNTCWVRVSEGWAGGGFGTQFLPRIGQQVLVDFIDGDPERPIITGRIYGASTGRTELPFPSPAARSKNLTMEDWLHPTPSGEFQRSGIRTRSTPAPDTGKAGFHLLRFDDTHRARVAFRDDLRRSAHGDRQRRRRSWQFAHARVRRIQPVDRGQPARAGRQGLPARCQAGRDREDRGQRQFQSRRHRQPLGGNDRVERDEEDHPGGGRQLRGDRSERGLHQRADDLPELGRRGGQARSRRPAGPAEGGAGGFRRGELRDQSGDDSKSDCQVRDSAQRFISLRCRGGSSATSSSSLEN